MGITRVMAFIDSAKADEMAGYYVADNYDVIRIDKPDIIELMKLNSSSEYWYSGSEVDYILIIATKDNVSYHRRQS